MKWYVALALCVCPSMLIAGLFLSKSAPQGVLIEAKLYKGNPEIDESDTIDRAISADSDCYYPNSEQQYTRDANNVKADSIGAESRISLHTTDIDAKKKSAAIKYYVRTGKHVEAHEYSIDLKIGESQNIKLPHSELYAIISATPIKLKQ